MNTAVDSDLIWRTLGTIPDPEFGLSIVDLGLVYSVETNGHDIGVTMTFTSPGCPAGGMILEGTRTALAALPGAQEVRVEVVWEPPWTPERLTPEGRAHLGWQEPPPAE
ncbi:metal-sulfur cluster assembly factor [Opitutus terrae]|uniref:MIP18 family-like domain-containing protein n=1 Tax=Opitutus terrae (strain DSM 11246 / JCM 15787 / PB90-1) TaxID=452637 RepID=B1ZWR1_OPITP|nr:metal-sulfur cluster assembly factor [Opitutus terrae]ACB74188.1 protein of unknown function DUF59 [Opitutus terrae PB90-1]